MMITALRSLLPVGGATVWFQITSVPQNVQEVGIFALVLGVVVVGGNVIVAMIQNRNRQNGNGKLITAMDQLGQTMERMETNMLHIGQHMATDTTALALISERLDKLEIAVSLLASKVA